MDYADEYLYEELRLDSHEEIIKIKILKFEAFQS